MRCTMNIGLQALSTGCGGLVGFGGAGLERNREGADVRRLRLIGCGLVLLGATALVGCGATSGDDVRLNVPYVEQDFGYYCAPASVLMWRLYDGLPEVSQAVIADYMGTTCTGTFSYVIANGVAQFTNSGSDAIYDGDAYDNRKYFVARQITSIDSYIPVIAVLQGNHAVVIDGGHHHEIPDSGGMQEWDYVYYQDPLVGPNKKLEAADWLTERCSFEGDTCEQIISANATGGWYYNYDQYSSQVVAGGSWEGGGGGPQKY